MAVDRHASVIDATHIGITRRTTDFLTVEHTEGVMSESSLPAGRRWFSEFWPITFLCFGIALSLGWAAFLGWLLVCTLRGLW
jgi:hypothetical protein